MRYGQSLLDPQPDWVPAGVEGCLQRLALALGASEVTMQVSPGQEGRRKRSEPAAD
jgi:hypothetical protein